MKQIFKILTIQAMALIFSSTAMALTPAQRTEAFRQCRSTDANPNFGDYVAAIVDGMQIRCIKRFGVTVNLEERASAATVTSSVQGLLQSDSCYGGNCPPSSPGGAAEELEASGWRPNGMHQQ